MEAGGLLLNDGITTSQPTCRPGVLFLYLPTYLQRQMIHKLTSVIDFCFVFWVVLQELGVSERLAVLIEGESLLNDGTSIVVFSVFFNAATGEGSTSAGTVVTQFARLGLGGPVVGFLTGMIG